MTDTIDILSVLSDDKTTVAYRPALARILDSALAAVLLQQIIYWWKQKDRLPFFKFKQPCKHKAYHGGDSWCEELALSRSEFDNALGVIGTKIKRGMTRESALAYKMPEEKDFIGFESGFKSALKIAFKHLILYWTDGNRITWYMINEAILKQILALAYGNDRPKAESSFTYVKQNPALPYKAESSFTYLTETTQRLHKEEESIADQKTSADLKADPPANLVAKTIEPGPKPEAQPDSVNLFQAALEPKEKGSGEKEKVSPAPNGQYVPPEGCEQVWVIHRATGARFEHLVNGATDAPNPVCMRCKLKLVDGEQTRLKPDDIQLYEHCLGKEPKKARASPKRRKGSLPASYGDLFASIRRYCFNDADGQAIRGRVGKTTLALLRDYPDVTVDEFQRFADYWHAKANKPDFPCGTDSLPTNFGKWKANGNQVSAGSDFFDSLTIKEGAFSAKAK